MGLRVPLGVAVLVGVALVVRGWSAPGGDSGTAGLSGIEGEEATTTVAVLPFENLSGAPEDAVFAAGIHSDLIRALSARETLRVNSRASVLPYAGLGTPLSAVAEELGADVILEGGVQRGGERVRVHVRLTDARNAQLLWAESYDRELTVRDLFAVQADITQRVVASLAASLSPWEPGGLEGPPTEAMTAYVYYHQAEQVYDGTRTGNEASERLLRLAIEEDSTFAPAWSSLASLLGWRPPYLGYGISAWDSALVFGERALALDPEHAAGYTVLSLIHGHQGQLQRQRELALEALRRNPSDGLAMRRLGESFREQGAFPEALDHHLGSVRLAPNHPGFRTWVGYTYMDLGRYEEAERWYREVLQLRPDFMYALQGLVIVYLIRGDRQSALKYSDRLVERYPEETIALSNAAMIGHYLGEDERVRRHAGRALELAEPGAPVRELYSFLASTMLGFVELREGDREAAESLFVSSLAFLTEMEERGAESPRWAFEIAAIHAARGELETARNWFERAVERGFRWIWQLEMEPMLASLEGDPRFDDLVARARQQVEEMTRRVGSGD